ncbi:MAG: FAD-dependent oxidoreductase [Victivallales bacterium]|nr:FAD-dependent oxidoreductase [Victivallales bacterium]
MKVYPEPSRDLPVRTFDVIVAGAGTAGVPAAIAAARAGARTAVIEAKGYPGGIAVEGGTALHSFYNLWKAFPGVEKRQVVHGIAHEMVQRLAREGGTSGHADMTAGFDYDSVCTAVDPEIYKRVAFEMMTEAGVAVAVNTLLAGAIVDGSSLSGVIVESRSGREAWLASAFVDSTGYGDLAAAAGATYTEPNDYPVANSIGVGGVTMECYEAFLEQHGAVSERAIGARSGADGQLVRLNARMGLLPPAFAEEARAIGMAPVTTTVHDGTFLFIKLNLKLTTSPTNRDVVAAAELELRQRQARAIELFRQHVPGCEKAFITRSSPSLCIRRGRLIDCDYDISLPDVLEGRHFPDDIMVYGFHDSAPRLQIQNGGTYGIPYRSLLPTGLDNLLVAGMMITANHDAHMSTRNTVCCMGQGQAAGTAAALCAQTGCTPRTLPFPQLRQALVTGDVYLEP